MTDKQTIEIGDNLGMAVSVFIFCLGVVCLISQFSSCQKNEDNLKAWKASKAIEAGCNITRNGYSEEIKCEAKP